MLVAINEDNIRVYANEAKKVDEYGNKIKYYCPHCHSELVLKQGFIKIPHFSHKSKSDCPFQHEGESYTHELMKNVVKEIIERDNDCLVSELEYPIGNRIADYYFERESHWIRRGEDTPKIKKIAVECVHKHTNIDDFRKKNVDYTNMGIYVIWIFNHDIFDGYHTKRINTIMKEAHVLGCNSIYTVDIKNKDIYHVHFHHNKRLKYKKSIIYMKIDKFSIINFAICWDSKKKNYQIKVANYDGDYHDRAWWILTYWPDEDSPFYYGGYRFISHEGHIRIDSENDNRFDSAYGTDYISTGYNALDEMERFFGEEFNTTFKKEIIAWLFDLEDSYWIDELIDDYENYQLSFDDF